MERGGWKEGDRAEEWNIPETTGLTVTSASIMEYY